MRATDLPAVRSPSTPARARLSDPTPAAEAWSDFEVDTMRPAPVRTAAPTLPKRRRWASRVTLRQVRLPGAWRRRAADLRWSMATWLVARVRATAPEAPQVQQPLVVFS